MESTVALRLEALSRSGDFDSAFIEEFGRWLKTADDPELFRVNPISWASARGIDEDLALALFLHATKVGLFEMSWGVVCPMCGMLITTPGGLKTLGPNSHCRLCRVDVSGFLDDAVEVVFSVAPVVRSQRYYDAARFDFRRDGMRLFFTPSMKPVALHHQLVEAAVSDVVLLPGAKKELAFKAERPGVYTVAAPTVHALAFLMTAPDGPAEVSLECLDGQFLPAQATIGEGKVLVRLHNRTEYTLPTAALYLGPHEEKPDEQPKVFEYLPHLSGKRLLTNQTFRDLFRTETIGSSGLQIKNLAMVFTDLQASTALYERVGDLRALDLVRAHFDLLQEVVARHRGAVVKTIGDAVMAAFGEPERALAAAAGMGRAVRKLNADGEHLVLKVGLHAGSCIAIQTNHQIDYFGRAVNIASRAQSVANGGEIVVTDAIWRTPGVPGLVEDYGLTATEDRVSLRGIADDVLVHRLA